MSDATNRGRAAVWLLLSALVVLADQLSKSYITSHYGEFEFTTVLPILDITRMHNVGAAFSFLALARSVPKGFSMMMRARSTSLASARVSMTAAAATGGIER